MTEVDTARTGATGTGRQLPASLRWTAWCMSALAAFQVLIAVLMYLNWEETVEGFTGTSFAPNRDAAEGAALGGLGMHVIMGVLYALLAWKLPRGRRWVQVLATILIGYNIIGGIGALFAISDETPLNPVGLALAVVAFILLWVPAASRAYFSRQR